LSLRVPVLESGDVKARTLVRVEEAHEAVGLVRQALERRGSGPLAVALGPRPAFEPAFTLVEGWRGTIIHWVMANAAGRLERVEVLDPSFLNWRALSYALLQNIVLDLRSATSRSISLTRGTTSETLSADMPDTSPCSSPRVT
jgi:Ni,Fe-hydrogenase III large subunit